MSDLRANHHEIVLKATLGFPGHLIIDDIGHLLNARTVEKLFEMKDFDWTSLRNELPKTWREV